MFIHIFANFANIGYGNFYFVFQLFLIDSEIIGNINSIRDWTDARDMVKAIYLIMQHEKPDDEIQSGNPSIWQ